jgi:hypothetical protein
VRSGAPGGRARPLRVGSLLLVAWLGVAAPTALRAQLRPLEPIPWEAVGAAGPIARIGIGYHDGARATVAGTRGRLLDLGDLTATWSLGRVALELGGTVMRVFADDSSYAAPVAGARESDASHRADTGEHRLGTIVRLASSLTADAVFRFGTRLPTTDNAEGLGRDQTDFYGTFGGRWRARRLEVTGEVGVGILETRLERPEQVDVLLYAARAGWRRDRARVWLEVVGQHDPRSAPELRGLEDLSEARLVGELGARRRLRLTVVRGLTFASPAMGATISVGAPLS